jgi:hypothetical protein
VVGDPINAEGSYPTTVIYDYTGGKKPYTLNYLERRFKVKAQKSAPPVAVATADGTSVPAPEIRIILGSDYKSNSTTQ